MLSGWEGWPTEATITRSDSLLDNGSLRLNFLNNNTYNVHFLHPTAMVNLQQNEMYRYSFSIQSDIRGQVQGAVRGESQLSGPYNMWEQQIPFDQERRDLEFFIRSDRTEPARVQYVTDYREKRYWLDNVKFERVQVTELDPYETHKLFVNELGNTQSFALPAGCWSDLEGVLHSGSIDVAAFRSKVLYYVPSGGGCGSPTNGSVGARVFLGGALTSTGLMRTNLRDQDLLPASEPYTAMGYTLGNPGATIAPGLLSATGANAVVDWVILELRSNDAGFPLVERRAALVLANGEVVSNTGFQQVPFLASVQGRHLVVRHRNHLPIMTAASLVENGLSLDLTTPGVSLYGQQAARMEGSVRSMWPGDVNGDGVVRFTGLDNDRDLVLSVLGGEVPTATVTGYMHDDANLDGIVKYTGQGNDRDVILNSVGGVVPTAVRIGQTP